MRSAWLASGHSPKLLHQPGSFRTTGPRSNLESVDVMDRHNFFVAGRNKSFFCPAEIVEGQGPLNQVEFVASEVKDDVAGDPRQNIIGWGETQKCWSWSLPKCGRAG